MPAPGSTPIILYHSTTASAVPSTSNLSAGELGINVTDKKVYSKDGGGSLITVVGTLGNQDASAVAITGGTLSGITSFASNNVTITGGSITGITDLSVADGGTGSSTASGARSNLSAAASGANSDITSLTALSTPLSVAQGGTGAATLTANNVILGNGTSAVAFVAPSTSGNVLTSDGTTWKSTVPAAASSGSGIFPITASVAANALTVTLNATTLSFRSATLTSGTVSTVTVASPISMVVSSGSTLGTLASKSARLALLAINNAGTAEMAISNLAGGVLLDESGVISTTAEGGAGGADSATVVYSTTARSNVPYRVVGFIDITETTPGTWATSPTLIQGCGGEALTSMASIGYGQTWQNLTGSRAFGTTYYNTTGRPIYIEVLIDNVAAGQITVTINGVALPTLTISGSCGFSYIIPISNSYLVTLTTGTANLISWAELR